MSKFYIIVIVFSKQWSLHDLIMIEDTRRVTAPPLVRVCFRHLLQKKNSFSFLKSFQLTHDESNKFRLKLYSLKNFFSYISFVL